MPDIRGVHVLPAWLVAPTPQYLCNSCTRACLCVCCAVSRFNTGEGASNVIPDQVEIQGTLRALTPETFERLHARLEQVCILCTGSAACIAELCLPFLVLGLVCTSPCPFLSMHATSYFTPVALIFWSRKSHMVCPKCPAETCGSIQGHDMLHCSI